MSGARLREHNTGRWRGRGGTYPRAPWHRLSPCVKKGGMPPGPWKCHEGRKEGTPGRVTFPRAASLGSPSARQLDLQGQKGAQGRGLLAATGNTLSAESREGGLLAGGGWERRVGERGREPRMKGEAGGPSWGAEPPTPLPRAPRRSLCALKPHLTCYLQEARRRLGTG